MNDNAKAPSSLEEGVGGGGALSKILLYRAKAMRNNPKAPEKWLWSALKGKHLESFKFRRQQVFGNRIEDFYCPSAMLAIEVDGDTHDSHCDAERDARLSKKRGIRTVRSTNLEVMRNLEGVLIALTEALRQSNHPPTPSLSKEGEAGSKATSRGLGVVAQSHE